MTLKERAFMRSISQIAADRHPRLDELSAVVGDESKSMYKQIDELGESFGYGLFDE